MPAKSLQRLLDGNDRFVAGRLQVEGVTARDLSKHTHQQSPHAVIITCSDSRLPVERLFDAGLGEMFVVRVAGNLATPAVIGSVEFAVNFLRAPLVIVMGHSDCGAIQGALNLQHRELDARSPLRELLADLASGILPPGACAEELSVSQAVALNVQRQVDALRAVPSLVPHLEAGRLWIVGAFYDTHAGLVRLLEHKGAEVGQPTHDA